MLWILDGLDSFQNYCAEQGYTEVEKKLEDARIACFFELSKLQEERCNKKTRQLVEKML